MQQPPKTPPEDDGSDVAAPAGQARGQIGENIAAVHEFYAREELRRGAPQRHAESVGNFVGRPASLVIILLSAAVWMLANLAMPTLGLAAIDPAPFSWLQGVVGLAALLTANVVLIKQNRVGKLSEQRAHLDLKVTLLIEQKVAKLIDLMEELRRDLPNVKDRHDGRAVVMQHPMSPERVLAALDEEVILSDGSTSAATTTIPVAPKSSMR
jgi:uncharacterized membrane protein